jgi:hypothetical protein
MDAMSAVLGCTIDKAFRLDPECVPLTLSNPPRK